MQMTNIIFDQQIKPPIYPLIAGGGSTFQIQLKEGTDLSTGSAHRSYPFFDRF